MLFLYYRVDQLMCKSKISIKAQLLSIQEAPPQTKTGSVLLHLSDRNTKLPTSPAAAPRLLGLLLTVAGKVNPPSP